jgi:hypothetical protein
MSPFNLVEGDFVVEAGRDAPLMAFDGVADGFTFSVNPDHMSGLSLPFTADMKLMGNALKATGTLDVEKLAAQVSASGDLKLPTAEITGLKADFRVAPLWPVTVPDGQKVSALAVQAGGFPLTSVEGRFGYRDGRLHVQGATALTLGGKVGLAPFSVAVPPREIEVTVDFDSLDLAQTLALSGVEGLGGEGRLSGQVPVRYAGGKLSIGEGQLAAAESGAIAYQPATPPAFLAEGGQGALLAQVFSNFRYNKLSLGLGGTMGDTLTLKARLEGNNPSFYDGHPVAFNLTLSGDLDSVLQQGLGSLHLTPEALGDLVQEGGKP